MSMRPELRLFFDGEPRTRVKAPPRREPHWTVAVYERRPDCEPGEYEWWDGTKDFNLPEGTFRAEFPKYWDALEFARRLANTSRDELRLWHDCPNATHIVLQDHNGVEHDRYPILGVVPAPKRKPWWLRMFGWR